MDLLLSSASNACRRLLLTIRMPFAEMDCLYDLRSTGGSLPCRVMIAVLDGKLWRRFGTREIRYNRLGDNLLGATVYADAARIGDKWDMRAMAVHISLAKGLDSLKHLGEGVEEFTHRPFATPTVAPLLSLYRFDMGGHPGLKKLGQKRYAGFPLSCMFSGAGHSITAGNYVGVGFPTAGSFAFHDLVSVLDAHSNPSLFLGVSAAAVNALVDSFAPPTGEKCNHYSPLISLGSIMERDVGILQDDEWGRWAGRILLGAGVRVRICAKGFWYQEDDNFYAMIDGPGFELFDVFDSFVFSGDVGNSVDIAALARLSVPDPVEGGFLG